MVEYLALPAWNTPARSIDEWVAALAEAGGPATTRRESSTVCWVLAPSIDVEGYALIEEGHPSAINFELNAADPSHALAVITAAAHSLGWEIHEDDEDDPDDDRDLNLNVYAKRDDDE